MLHSKHQALKPHAYSASAADETYADIEKVVEGTPCGWEDGAIHLVLPLFQAVHSTLHFLRHWKCVLPKSRCLIGTGNDDQHQGL